MGHLLPQLIHFSCLLVTNGCIHPNFVPVSRAPNLSRLTVTIKALDRLRVNRRTSSAIRVSSKKISIIYEFEASASVASRNQQREYKHSKRSHDFPYPRQYVVPARLVSELTLVQEIGTDSVS